ncbi:MAG: AmmeMemoRadiSam system protein A [Lachnospiraceae bacterium]|nr:AmmeMemoRadiSam system protein A [Lachnospiraceae bacterium]
MSIVAAFMVPHPPLIVPNVGKGGEAEIEETTRSYDEVGRQIAKLKPDTIVISSPHSVMYADYFHISPGRHASGSFSRFNAPEVKFDEDYDDELVKRIEKLCEEKDFPAGTLGERDKELDHGTMVPLYFIRKYLNDFKLVRLGLSGLDLTRHYELGQIINEAVEELKRRVVYVASGDLSHKLKDYGPYGFAKEGPVYDERIMDVCSRGEFLKLFDFDENFCEKAAECGHRSFVIMAGALDGKALSINKLSHQDVTGVGYGICTFYPEGEDDKRHFLKIYREKKMSELTDKQSKSDAYVKLARETVNEYIVNHRTIGVPNDLPEEMYKNSAGAFVSIHENGRLRGCIGTFLPTTDCIAEEIIQNAISASVRDPRFDPIKPYELPFLEINVDILSKPEDIDSPDMLDVKKYGVIVKSGSRRGLLLPDLDGVDTVEEQIEIARNKAGISASEPITLQRFEVVRHY